MLAAALELSSFGAPPGYGSDATGSDNCCRSSSASSSKSETPSAPAPTAGSFASSVGDEMLIEIGSSPGEEFIPSRPPASTTSRRPIPRDLPARQSFQLIYTQAQAG